MNFRIDFLWQIKFFWITTFNQLAQVDHQQTVDSRKHAICLLLVIAPIYTEKFTVIVSLFWLILKIPAFSYDYVVAFVLSI